MRLVPRNTTRGAVHHRSNLRQLIDGSTSSRVGHKLPIFTLIYARLRTFTCAETSIALLNRVQLCERKVAAPACSYRNAIWPRHN